MSKYLPAFSIAILAAVAAIFIGCTPPEPTPPPLPPVKPYASTQTADVVAELETLKITRGDLDGLLYEAYGLRMLFDIVELNLAKDTLLKQGLVITPEDFQNEREIVMAGIRGDEAKSADQDEDLLNQMLQREHFTRAEFEIKAIQTEAYLRKIVSHVIVGKLTEKSLRGGFDLLYGAKRQIADIQLANVRDANAAVQRLQKEPFGQVAQEMSIDPKTRDSGGLCEPFSAQSHWIPQVILDAAFSLEPGKRSDILEADGKYHIILVVKAIDPKIVKFEDVKDDVRRQLEGQLIKANMATLREELLEKTRQDIRLDEPILKAQWDKLVDQQKGKNRDRDTARKALNEQAATQPSSAATTAP